MNEKAIALEKTRDELDAAVDHITSAFDMAHANNLPNLADEILTHKMYLLILRKDVNAKYKAEVTQ